jgi:hypothetical protein
MKCIGDKHVVNMMKEIWLGGYLLFSHMKLGHMMQYGIWVS